jgi:Bacterial PH domain
VSPDGTPLPALPVTWRPRRARIVAYGTAVVIVAGMIVLAVALPGGSGGFRPIDRIGVIVIGFGVAWLLSVLARPRVSADEKGVTVINVFRRRRLEWAEIVEVNLRVGDPWVYLDLTDGTVLPVMGLQAADGEHGRAMARELRALVRTRTRTSRND